MTRLSAAMVRMLARVPDPPGMLTACGWNELVTADCLYQRGLVEKVRDCLYSYRRTPFGRETAEKLTRRGEK